MKRRVIIIWLLLAGVLWAPCRADVRPNDPPHITDNFDIMFGSNMTSCLGDPAYLVPINVSVSQLTFKINMIITYDQALIVPTLLAPNIFMQYFTYDISMPGRIRITMIPDMAPPPDVPPIYGDTTVAWISFSVTSRALDWDLVTHLNYYDDPLTPYSDNYIVINGGIRLSPPYLGLHQGDLTLKHPNYGDINLNTLPFEIGDAVLFCSYLSGIAHLNQCQIANSDCNRDGVQASIADLVYMLRRINYDSIRFVSDPEMPVGGNIWRPSGGASQSKIATFSDPGYGIAISGDVPLGGAAFSIVLDDSSYIPDAVALDPAAQYMQMYCNLDGNLLKVVIVNWDPSFNSFRSGRLFSIHYPGSNQTPPFKIESGDFSDNDGRMISPEYHLEGVDERGEVDSAFPIMSLSGYPNPFKKSISVSFGLPSDGHYQMAVYDILGRKVRSLFNDFESAGTGQIVWDGRDEAGGEVASGTYFLRLQGDEKVSTIKLFFLK